MVTIVPAIKGFVASFDPSRDRDVNGYVVHASTISGFTPDAGNLIANGPDTVVPCQVTYTGIVYVRVAAYDSFEDLDNINFAGLNYSSEYSVYVGSNNPLDRTAPDTPTGVSVVTAADISGQADTCYATVSWSAVADTDMDLAGYIVQIRKGVETTYSEFRTAEISYKITNLVPVTTYAVRVASYDKWGNVSGYSSWTDATTGKDTGAPTVPTQVVCSGGFDTILVSVSGATNSDFHHYDIQLDYTATFPAPTTVTTTSSITTIKVGEGLTYYVRARSVDRAGNTSAWVNASGLSISTALVLPSAMYNELRTDFLINNVLFKFGRTGDTTYPVDTSLYVVSTSGNILWKNKSYTITNGVTTLASATGKYVKATCDGTANTATLSLIATSTDLTTLASNELILAVTSAAKQPDSNGNYVCYVRNGNSLELEGALIRSATIDTAKIKQLDIGNAVVTGTLRADQIGANLITADKIATGVTGNVCLGKPVDGTNGPTTFVTDGLKSVGSPYYTFCVNAGTQVNNAPEVNYFQVDLGVTRNIGQVILYFYSGNARSHLYKLKYSINGTDWFYMAGDQTDTGWVYSTPSIDGMTMNPTIVQPLNVCSARYIRVYGNGSTVNTYNHIYEIEAFEYGTLISGDQLTTGKISAQTSISIGDSKVVIDGASGAIKVSDGTITDRVTLGRLSSGSYGIDIKNAAGSSIFYTDGNINGARISNLSADNIVAGGSIIGSTFCTSTSTSSGERFIVDKTSNKAHFWGDDGNGVIRELATIGTNTAAGLGKQSCAAFGALDTGNKRIGLTACADTEYAIYAASYGSTTLRALNAGAGTAVEAYALSGVGVQGWGGLGLTYGGVFAAGSKGAVLVGGLGSAPAYPDWGSIYFNTSNRHFYGYDGLVWKQLDN